MDKIKQELRTLIGDSILLFQRYEYTFKSVLTLALIDIEGTTESVSHNLNNRKDIVYRKTLGQLVRQYVEEILESPDSSDINHSESKPFRLSMRFSVETDQQSKAYIEEKYKTFVDDRNFVVHHLISELIHDDESSYKSMIMKLTDIKNRFEEDLQDLNQTRQMIIEGYKYLLNSDEMKKL